jgi:hypothetical protein
MSDEHEYPSDYAPGTHWAIDEAWAILDTIKPGVISADVRAFLAGQIAARLMRRSSKAKAPPSPGPAGAATRTPSFTIKGGSWR